MNGRWTERNFLLITCVIDSEALQAALPVISMKLH